MWPLCHCLRLAPRLHFVKQHRSKLLFSSNHYYIMSFTLFISSIFLKIEVSNHISSCAQLKVKYTYKYSPEAMFVKVVKKTVKINRRIQACQF